MSELVFQVGAIDVFHLSTISGIFGVYIALLSLLVFRYAYRNMAGEVGRGRFLGWLVFTVLSVEGLVAAGNFAVFLGFWFATSAGVHHLLEHFKHRQGARLVAWEKFLVSRIGDVALIVAAGLLFATRGSLNFADFASQSWSGEAAQLTALLVVLGALTKSAQVPFHSWLPRTLEAPTAVSALLHAGIINAGGYLLIRFGFLVQEQPVALTVLVVLGGVTALWGGFSMLVQADIKRRLAWSTVGQMGFMMLEIGLGAPALALVHLMGHGFYKARAFLWSGDPKTGKSPLPAGPGRWGATVAGLLLWLATGSVGGVAVGLLPGHHLVLTLVVWAALTPLAVGGWSRPNLRVRSWVASAALLGASITLTFGATWAFGLPDTLSGHLERDVAGLAVAAGLLVSGLFAAFSPWLSASVLYRQLYSSALHGFGGGRWLEVLASQFLPRTKSQPFGGQS